MTLTKHIINAIVFFQLLTGKNPLIAQQASAVDSLNIVEKNLYETALLQVESLLLRQAPQDSLIFDLITDARSLAGDENWREGREILNTVFELCDAAAETNFSDPGDLLSAANKEKIASTTPEYMMYDTSPKFQIETGVDYSLQEFEIAYIENDSILVEELQNPYVSLNYYQPLNIGELWFQANHRMRLDNQFFNYSLFVSLEKRWANRVRRFEVDGNYFHTRDVEGSNFLDSRVSYFYGNPYDFKNRWYVNLRSRYKWYTQPFSGSSNILSGGLNAYYEHFFDFTHSFYLSWSPTIYRESQAGGYRYFQNRLGGFYRTWENYNRYVEAGMEILYQDSENTLEDEPYKNSYLSFLPRVEMEWPFNSWLGIEAKLWGEQRNYRTADAINPNYTYLYFQGIQKFYRGDLNSFGIGYFREKQTHGVDIVTDEPFAEQADFNSQGVVVTGEYLDLNGILFNAEYRVSWRTYPNAEYSVFSSYYSNRYVHSLSLFGWIPLTSHWQLQLFANYDNDQDRDNERNDTRNTILNFGVIYKF